MRARVGTSGWSYDEWKGPFYPEDLPKDAMLRHYAQRLRSVEVNNTFYRLPSRSVLEGWAAQVPDGFSFVLKASRRITHNAKLGPDAADPLGYLMTNCEVMGDKLGPILFQTPRWVRKDVSLLRDFLEMIPPTRRAAFEFRSTSWFDDEVYGVLRDRDAALVVADTGDADKDPPLTATASWGYARLRRETYEDGMLADWADRLREQPWDDLYVFFKHEDEGAGPRLAARFLEMLEAGPGKG